MVIEIFSICSKYKTCILVLGQGIYLMLCPAINYPLQGFYLDHFLAIGVNHVYGTGNTGIKGVNGT